MRNQEADFSMNDMLFIALVRDFESMAMVGFGKLVDPVSQTAERNLERAKVAIDMIGMLEEKTKGNLNDTETALLQQVLTNLRLNYVDELEKDEAERAQEGGGEKTADATGEADKEGSGENIGSTGEGEKEAATEVGGAGSEAEEKKAESATGSKRSSGAGGKSKPKARSAGKKKATGKGGAGEGIGEAGA